VSTPEDQRYAGDITPEQAWKLLAEDPAAVLVDCRTEAEWRFVGVPDLTELRRDVVYVEWNKTDGSHNDAFVADLTSAGVTPAQRPVIFLCRSGNRSIGAAIAATEAGLGPSYNVLDGFEGNLDQNRHRGGTGWKAVGLPWKQS
jgi:rhodanese-related sulfurtransferase